MGFQTLSVINLYLRLLLSIYLPIYLSSICLPLNQQYCQLLIFPGTVHTSVSLFLVCTAQTPPGENVSSYSSQLAKLYVITFVRRVQAERTGFRLSSKVWTRLYLWLLVFRVFLIPRYRGRYRESSACWGPGPAPRAAEPQQLLEREPPGGRGSERVLHTDAGEAGPGLQWGTVHKGVESTKNRRWKTAFSGFKICYWLCGKPRC